MSKDKHTQYKIIITRIGQNIDDVANMIAENYALDTKRVRILLKNLPYEIPEKFESLQSSKSFLDKCNKLKCQTKVVRLSSEVDEKSEHAKENKHRHIISDEHEQDIKNKKADHSTKIIIAIVIILIFLLWFLFSFFYQDLNHSANSLKVDSKDKQSINLTTEGQSSKALGQQNSETKPGLVIDNDKAAAVDSRYDKVSQVQNRSSNDDSKSSKIQDKSNSNDEQSSDDNEIIIDLKAMSDLLTPEQIKVLSAFDFQQPMDNIVKAVENSSLSRREKIEIANIYQEAAKADLNKTKKALEISLAFNHNNKRNWLKLISTYEMLGEAKKAETAREQMYNNFPYLKNKEMNQSEAQFESEVQTETQEVYRAVEQEQISIE